MDRSRSDRPSDRRPPRDDTRNHKPRYGTDHSAPDVEFTTNGLTEQDRSRSPPRRDRRDDHRRDRSPPRGPAARSGPPPTRSDRDRDFQRRDGGPLRGRPDIKPRQPTSNRPNGAAPRSAPGEKVQQADTMMEDAPEDEDSDAEMKRIMGFGDFRSTKNTKVPGNDKNYGIHKVKKAEYRQYMNRVGGFNRPLEAM